MVFLVLVSSWLVGLVAGSFGLAVWHPIPFQRMSQTISCLFLNYSGCFLDKSVIHADPKPLIDEGKRIRVTLEMRGFRIIDEGLVGLWIGFKGQPYRVHSGQSPSRKCEFHCARRKISSG